MSTILRYPKIEIFRLLLGLVCCNSFTFSKWNGKHFQPMEMSFAHRNVYMLLNFDITFLFYCPFMSSKECFSQKTKNLNKRVQSKITHSWESRLHRFFSFWFLNISYEYFYIAHILNMIISFDKWQHLILRKSTILKSVSLMNFTNRQKNNCTTDCWYVNENFYFIDMDDC